MTEGAGQDKASGIEAVCAWVGLAPLAVNVEVDTVLPVDRGRQHDSQVKSAVGLHAPATHEHHVRGADAPQVAELAPRYAVVDFEEVCQVCSLEQDRMGLRHFF